MSSWHLQCPWLQAPSFAKNERLSEPIFIDLRKSSPLGACAAFPRDDPWLRLSCKYKNVRLGERRGAVEISTRSTSHVEQLAESAHLASRHGAASSFATNFLFHSIMPSSEHRSNPPALRGDGNGVYRIRVVGNCGSGKVWHPLSGSRIFPC